MRPEEAGRRGAGAPPEPAAITVRFDHADMIESALPADAIENADANDPIDPIDSAEPIDPIDRTEPLQPMQRSESSDQSDHLDATAPTLARDHDELAGRRRCGSAVPLVDPVDREAPRSRAT